MKKVRRLVVLITISLLLIGSGILVGTACSDTINLKFSSPWPPQHPQHTMVIIPWSQKITELTKGRVKFTLFPGQALGSAKDQYDMTEKGICDAAIGLPSYAPSRFPLTSAFWLPFMTASAEKTSVALWKTYEKYLKDEYKEVKVLWHYVHAPGQLFTTNKKIASLSDLKGLKIRATDPYIQESLSMLGAAPISIPVPDVYHALDRGVVDGTAMPFEGMWVFKQYEAVRYVTPCDLYTQSFAVVMNKKRFAGLPPDIAKVIDDNIGLEMSRRAGFVYDQTEAKLKQNVLDAGIEVVNLPPGELDEWKNDAKKIREEWISEMEEKGLKGREVLAEIQRLLDIE